MCSLDVGINEMAGSTTARKLTRLYFARAVLVDLVLEKEFSELGVLVLTVAVTSHSVCNIVV